MLRPDRFVALCLLAFAVAYGAIAWQYPLLPFEQATPFKPNTMPLGLAAVAVVLSFVVVLFPGGKSGLAEDAAGWRDFDWRAAVALLVLAVLYAAVIRPLGYLAATTLFIVAAAAALGERRFVVLTAVAFIAALATWYLVQEVLGVFLKPLPAGWGGD